MSTPQYFTYDAANSVMVPRSRTLADRTYVEGEEYRLGVIEERSANSHSYYFARVNEVWKNLREDDAERFQTADHLRKFALIKCGFYIERYIVCGTHAEALRIGAFIRPMDEFAIVTVDARVVRQFTAKSQSMAAMGRKDFQASKQAVLDFITPMIGVTAKELEANTGGAA